MLRSFLLFMGLVALSCTTTAADDPEIPKITGTWKASEPKWDVLWTFTHKDGKWEVTGSYVSKGEEVGTAVGTKVAYKNGVLTWTREFTKKPDTSYTQGAVLSFKLTDKGGELTATAGKVKQVRAYTKVDMALAKDNPKPDPKVDPKTDPKVDPKVDSKGGEGYRQVDEVKGDRSLVGIPSALSPDGMRVALFNPKPGDTGKSEIAIWDFKEKKVITRLAPKGLGHRLVWSADGSSLVTSWFAEGLFKIGELRKPDIVTVWDTADWKEKATFEVPSSTHPAITADGKMLAVGSRPSESGQVSTVVFFDVAQKKELYRVNSGAEVVFSRDGKTAAVNAVVKDTAISIIDTTTGKPKVNFPTGRWPFALSDDGKTLVATHGTSGVAKGKTFANEGVIVYDTANPKSGKEYLFENQGGIGQVGLLDKGQFVVLAGTLADVRILDTKTGKIVHRITPVKGLAVVNMGVSADSSRILVLGGDYKTRIYSTPFGPKP